VEYEYFSCYGSKITNGQISTSEIEYRIFMVKVTFDKNKETLSTKVKKGKGKVIPLQTRCGPEGG
jgi:hypothetical protein